MPEVKKVKDFLDGISDSTLQPVKYTIAGFSHLMSNFHEAANYIGNIIDLNKKNEFCHVGAAVTGRGKGWGGAGRGGGRDANTGNRGGRNKGRGKGRGLGGRRGGCGQQNPGRWISYEEWQNIDESEKKSIRVARANYAKCSIGAVETDATADDEPSSTFSPKHSNTADTAAAGDHMSRGNRSYISKISSGKRYNRNQTHSTAVSAIHQYPSSKIEAKAELDSHADTTVAGSTCRVIEYTEEVCDVFPFSSEYQPMKQVPVAKVATAYDHPQTGETFILIFVQALYLGDQP